MKTKNLLLCFFVILSSLASCKKYSEGPSLSLRSRAERVANTWKMEQVIINGSDVTTTYTGMNYTETYDKGGAYSYNSSLGGGSGKWAFQENDTQIKRNGVSGQPTVDMTILRLKEKSFWYRFTDGKDTYEFHLVPN